MTKEQKKFIEEIKSKLKEQVENTDTEEAHLKADELIIELLIGVGLKDVAAIYSKVGKWYA